MAPRKILARLNNQLNNQNDHCRLKLSLSAASAYKLSRFKVSQNHKGGQSTHLDESQSMRGSVVLRTAFSTARTDVISRAYEQVATMLPDAPATAIEVTFTDDIINLGPTLNISHKDHIIAYAVSED